MPPRLPHYISSRARLSPRTSCSVCQHCISQSTRHSLPRPSAGRSYSSKTQISTPVSEAPPEHDSITQSEDERHEKLRELMLLDLPSNHFRRGTTNFQEVKTMVGDYQIQGWTKDAKDNYVKVKGEMGRRAIQIRFKGGLVPRKRRDGVDDKSVQRGYAKSVEGLDEKGVEGGDEKTVEERTAVPYRPISTQSIASREIAFYENAPEKTIAERIAPQGRVPAFNRIYTPMWLRDHCQCTSCVHPDTKQRLLNTFAISPLIEPGEMSLDKSGLRIKWDADYHESFYAWDWLFEHPFLTGVRYAPLDEPRILWREKIRDEDVTVSYEEVMASEKGVASWTSKIHRFGYCYVEGCPVTPEATEQLLKRIAFIRDTHYGAFWDFTSDLTLKDTAYTNLPLSAHTDNTYFTDPAGLQMFHLLSHESGTGGASLLVDGFQAAKILRNESLDAYNILSRVKLPWHASGNEGLSIRPAMTFPVLEHWSEHPKATPELVRVRWNNDDRGTMDNWGSTDEGRLWYDAARKWVSILNSKELEILEQLRPGRPVIFDNWRMLHGRSAFTGKRRMCGGYINMDDFLSRYRMTNFGREAVLNSV